MILTVLIILLILGLIGGYPAGPWWGANGSSYGWGPSGVLGVVLVVILVLVLLGRVPF